MSVKSSTALQYNVKLLEDALPDGECLKMWTFTLPVRLHPVVGAAMWQDVARELKRSMGFKGVRVFELHPGGHGLHVHVAVNQWFDVHEVRMICQRFGWGRVHVEDWDNRGVLTCGEYLAKYLTKQNKVWQGMHLRGVRWWATFGDLPDKVRVRDVSIDSPRRRLWDLIPSWVVCHIMGVSYNEGEGECSNPTAHKRRVVAACKEAFRSYYLKQGFSSSAQAVACGVKFNGARAYNWAKMWLVNRIYFDVGRISDYFDGSRDFGMRFRTLGWNCERVRSMAFHPCPF